SRRSRPSSSRVTSADLTRSRVVPGAFPGRRARAGRFQTLAERRRAPTLTRLRAGPILCSMRHRFPLIAAALGLTLDACEPSHAAAPQRDRVGTKLEAENGRERRVLWFEGACDASGAVPLDKHRFVVADDEDNVLRVYHADRGGPPLARIDLSPKLALRKQKKAESDIEGATRVG